MTPTLSFLLSYILLYRYSTLFVVIFVSAIILPLPVTVLLTAVGAFSNQGYFSFTFSFFTALCANVLGDFLIYFLMKKYGHEVIREKYAKKYSFLTKLEQYVKHHAGLTIFFSRLIGVLGPPVNFLSGYMKVPTHIFIFYDTLGNALEIGIFLVLGFAIGDAWGDVSGMISLIQGMLLVAVLVFILYHVYKKEYLHILKK
ncbi:MAG: VTT domain-containing protein [Patescibacteria group bacterium]